MNKPFTLLTIFISLQLPAIAQQATAFKDKNSSLFLYALPPNQAVEIEIQKPLEKAVQANSCGLIIVKSDDTFSVESQTIMPNFNFNIRELPKTCTELVGYPQIFKTPTGAIAIGGKTPNAAYTISYPNHKVKKQLTTNACGFVQIRNFSASFINLPTVTGGRADFAFSALSIKEPLLCFKSVLYFPLNFNPRDAIANAVGFVPRVAPPPTTTITSQTAQPIAAKSGNYLIVSSIPPGTYAVSNAANPTQNKSYTVTSRGCLVSDVSDWLRLRTHLGTPSAFLISRQGLTFPVVWSALQQVPTVPTCN
ncbi:hypothetical protein PQG02_32325 (plasmid) [Nostoc sp. UHCC 0926]|uniref:hypothetical protein n=1 Tax=Nostoc sp. UHCC 0926 TaxID=3025190 RepID=UPI00236114CF|nr:hypothetical protein [Nostoc sp. UHCC 0926]WDD36088.1 hypothetical protein PQG02_32325 [Nostoc sp. UHCC 0926]